MADWYPTLIDALPAWWANFSSHFSIVSAKYGFTKPDLDDVTKDNAWIQYWCPAKVQAEQQKQTVNTYFTIISGNDTSLDPPAVIDFALSGTAPSEPAPGIEKRVRDIARQIKNHSDYSAADGDMLGITSASTAKPDPATVKPTIDVSPAQSGYLFSVVVSNRGEADQWQAQAKSSGGASWDTVATATGKSVDVIWTPTTAGKPDQIQVRVQLRKGNANYGQLSEIAQITVNP